MSEIKFYSTKGEHGCFSNFSKHPLTLKDQTWPTSEHYFQAQKFAGTKFETAVRKCDSAKEAAEMGRERSLPLRSDWLQVRDDVMREAVYAKFSQNEDCKKTLLSTGDAELIEHTTNDSYWGDGGDGSGQNMLGRILMETRTRLRSERPEEADRAAKFSQLEKEFTTLVTDVTPEIEAELKLAKAALKRAEAIAEKHGVPFKSNIYTWVGAGYVPKSFHATYEEMSSLDEEGTLYETLYDLLEFSPTNDYDGELITGWECAGWSSSSLRC